jgi:uncharacterized membrane protein
MARAAGKLAGRWLPVARQATQAAQKAAQKQTGALSRQWVPAARQSGQFVKHVLPEVARPLHSLWHQVLGFIFLVFAGTAAWKVWRTEATIAPPMLAVAVIFIVVMAGYGISSIRKSNRISRS